MPMTLLQLKNYIKSSRGLTRTREDGLLSDALIGESIEAAIKRVSGDCDLLPTTMDFHLVAGQWEYPIPEEVVAIRDFWRKDTNGSFLPMAQITQEQFRAGRDPVKDKATDPSAYAYPIHQGRIYQFFVKAPDNYDFTDQSRVTAAHRRTVEDSGANFGKTLSGDRMSPGDVVYNITGKSYGYVEVLDCITNKSTGSCAAATSSTQVVVTGKNFETLDVKEDDVIFYPGTGVVTAYGFITDVDVDTLTYEAMRGNLSRFTSGDSIRVGTANKIRLSAGAPHRGLRQGSRNYFTISTAAKASITGTTFSPTRCTGSGVSGSEVGDEAIASGGSHGKISGVESGYVDVDMWIGGVPTAGETVSVKECDAYTIETEARIQAVVWLSPTPSSSDTAGSPRLFASIDCRPIIPTEDYQYIDIPEKYEDALKTCAEWQCAKLAGNLKPNALFAYQKVYQAEVDMKAGEIHDVARGEVITPWTNRGGGSSGKSFQGVNSGHPYDISDLLANN